MHPAAIVMRLMTPYKLARAWPGLVACGMLLGSNAANSIPWWGLC